ncbi:PBN1-like protein [Fusarium coicis]|nr:PBN1-like protein [Fusarium coicis]
MRERVTFIHNDYTLDPEQLDNQEAGLLGPQIESVRQDKLTIPLDELPSELTDILQEYEALHIRWASPVKSETLDPFASRISPGLHVYVTPESPNSCNPTKLCGWLQRFGPLACSKPEAFTEFKQPATSAAPNFSFHQTLEDLHSFITISSQEFCPKLDAVCNARLRSLLTATSLDLSFDKSTKALVASALWPLRPQTVAVPASTERRVEVGIFVNDRSQPNMKENELGVAGVLSVLGDKKKPSPTIFTFPARHRRDESVFTSRFLTPTGLHPTLQLSFSSNKPPSAEGECTPYAFLTLPKVIFADRYQLGDDLFLASKNLIALRYTTLPVDLEAPAYTTETWGSSILLELAPPPSGERQPWNIEIPLHLRYLKPSVTDQAEADIPYPAVFWACSSGEETLENPFDRLHIGYDNLFPRDTAFWHVTPQPEGGSRLMHRVTVPVLKLEGIDTIRTGTAIAVSLGFAWVLWKLVGVMLKSKKPVLKKTAPKRCGVERVLSRDSHVNDAPSYKFQSPSVSQRNGTVFPTQPSQLPPATNGAVFSLSSNLQSPQQPQSFVSSATLLEKTEPTKSRMLGVISTACRRYAKDEQLVTLLLDSLNRDVWALLQAITLDLESIQTLLIICTWPFPTIRFVTDPSPNFISSALNACMLLGLHTGRGSHPSFLIGGRQHMTCTDYEASITWVFCSILAQRVSTGNGHPPPFLQHNDTKCKDTIKDSLAPELLTFFELQKFSNRLHTAMSAQISANNGVPETIVKMWEDEFELLRPLVSPVETDFSRFIMLVARLEVQAYYYISPPDQRPNFTLNTLRTYNTSQNLINTALTLESTCQLLTHSPHWVYRALVDASCILLSTLHSTAAPQHLSSSDAEVVAAQVLSLLKTCSVRDNDLPTRGSIILETFWSVRHLLPKWDIPVGAWPDRIGAATSYWCLTAFKNALQEAKNITDGTQKGIDAFQQRFPGNNNGDDNDGNANANTDINGQEQTMDSTIDPLQGIDWSMIIDDFGWIGEGPVFLGPA